MHEGLKGFCKSKNLFECLKLLVQLRTQHLQRAMFVDLHDVLPNNTKKLCGRILFPVFTRYEQSEFKPSKEKMVRWEDFISIFYRHFIINLYLYSSVILPTVFITRSGLPHPVPFNQFCIFLNPKFGLFNLKTDISSLY